MQIPEITPEVMYALFEMWAANGPRMPDAMRPPEVLEDFLVNDGGATRFYQVEDQPSVVMVGSIQPGLNAQVMLLNHEFAELGALMRELRGIIDEFELRRLTAQVPGPVKDVQRQLEAIGFRKEGHLRRSTLWNDRLVGMDLWGLYRDPARDQRYKNARQEEAVSA